MNSHSIQQLPTSSAVNPITAAFLGIIGLFFLAISFSFSIIAFIRLISYLKVNKQNNTKLIFLLVIMSFICFYVFKINITREITSVLPPPIDSPYYLLLYPLFLILPYFISYLLQRLFLFDKKLVFSIAYFGFIFPSVYYLVVLLFRL
ncbi:MAG: hypothetical protein M3Q44_03150 [bacterium]|nr:hypothetical protein [bacterium]